MPTMEGNGRFWCLLWKVLEGDGNGRKRGDRARSVKKYLVSTSVYVARYDVTNQEIESAV